MITIGNTSSQVQKLRKELNNKSELLDDNLFDALNQFSLVFSGLANANLGKKNFSLTGKIKPYLSKRNLEGGAQVDETYAAFLEFGTRSLVKVPSEFKSIANQFKGIKVKSGVSFRDAIENWIVKKLGKTEEEAKQISFPIMMKILKVGTRPQPFMYPAFKDSIKDLYRFIKSEIKNTTK
jgi:hypothetical protein